MKILILNWKDIKNPDSGGAEYYIHTIIEKVVSKKNTVTLFTSRFKGGSKKESFLDGRFIVFRKGSKFTVYFWAPVYYILFLRKNNYDLIIDCENGIPFFSPVFSRVPCIFVVYHIHKEVFNRELGVFKRMLGNFLEGFLMPKVYGNIPIVTISKCTGKDLMKLGFTEKNINIICPGISLPSDLQDIKKTDYPSIVYFNRFSKYKNVEDTIYVLQKLIKEIPDIKLSIGGCKGTARENEYKKLVRNLGLDNNIEFFPFVEKDTDKFNILGFHWVHILPSMKEGFGISVIESAAVGTPTVGYDVPGLRSTVINGKTGFLVPYRNVDMLVKATLEILTRDKTREYMVKNCKEFSRNFTWEKTANEFMQIIEKYIHN